MTNEHEVTRTTNDGIRRCADCGTEVVPGPRVGWKHRTPNKARFTVDERDLKRLEAR